MFLIESLNMSTDYISFNTNSTIGLEKLYIPSQDINVQCMYKSSPLLLKLNFHSN